MPELLTLPPGPAKKPWWYYPLILVLAVLIIGGLWLIERSLRGPFEPHAPEALPGGPQATTEEREHPFDDLVTVADQDAGSFVMVDMVDIGAPGVWVVVHELKNGELWNALGAARVKGPAKNVRVDLLRNTTPGTTYAVVLYRDDGDEVYELHGDSVYVDFGSGARVSVPFTAR